MRPIYMRPEETVRFHQVCWDERVAARKAADVAKRIAQLDDTYQRSIGRLGTCYPRWPFARLDNPAFRSRVSPVFLAAVEGYVPQEDGSLVLSGFTGCGKTSLVCARIDDELRRAKEATVPGKTGSFLGFAFITGPELVQSRRQTRLGSGKEAELVDLAMSIELLILDEVGFEASNEIVFDVLDRRLRTLSPTILTTGLRPKEFRERYGDATWRRIAEQGAVFEDWKTDG